MIHLARNNIIEGTDQNLLLSCLACTSEYRIGTVVVGETGEADNPVFES